VEKRFDWWLCQCVQQLTNYLLFCTCWSFSTGFAPALANPKPTLTVNLEQTKLSAAQFAQNLRYQIVQTEPGKTKTELYPTRGVVELNSEEQEFNNNTQVITAKGKVILRFKEALLRADTLEVNLNTKIAIAQGNVALKRGKQTLYGNRFEYNFEADRGTVFNGRGDIYQPSLVTDLNIQSPPPKAGDKPFPNQPLSEQLQQDQPITNLRRVSSTGVTVGSDRDIEFQPTLKPKGSITRLRFQADKIDFEGRTVNAENLRITNDPFSPPELQVQADRAQFKTISEEEDEITTVNGRITIEDNFNIPLIRDRLLLNKLGKDPNPFNIGFDDDERGGLFVERNFYPIFDRNLRVTITPQYFLQRAITNWKFIDSSVLGVRGSVEATLSPDTSLEASAAIAGVDLSRIGNNLRAKASVKQNLNLFDLPHTLTGETVYRDRIFNGSLGYQDVQSSIGGILTSNRIPIGNTGVSFDYQAGGQIISANSDRADLLAAANSQELITLNRYQIAANAYKSFKLWEGKGLPVNERETYNYSPVPVVPYLQLNTSLKGAFSFYSSGDTQSSIGYSIGLQGQVGNFSKSSFDYTGFNISYSQDFRGGLSPFLFDRIVDNRILSAGINQHISGPWRLGIQSSINLDDGKQISIDYYLEYSRRTYNILIRYNPTLRLGSIGFRLNDFSWDGESPEF
jgi:hypothetical protein